MKPTLIKALLMSMALGTAATAAAAAEMNPIPASLAVAVIDHVGMNVPDIDQATAFFSDLMGAKVIADARPGNIPESWKAQFRWHPSSDLQRFVMLQMAGGAKVELFQYRGADINPDQPHGDDAGASHIALQTADIDGSLALLQRKGITILNQPITNPDGIRWFYFATPWGAQIELVQLPG